MILTQATELMSKSWETWGAFGAVIIIGVYIVYYLKKQIDKKEKELKEKDAKYEDNLKDKDAVIADKDEKYEQLAQKTLVLVTKVEDKMPIMNEVKELSVANASKMEAIAKSIEDLKDLLK